jgi:parallel beta-helix repeat protein
VKASRVFLFVFLIAVSLCLVNTQPVKSQSSGTIYIRADGTVEGTDKIQRDGNVYTFTCNISIDSGDCGIEVERDNIVIDGAGFALQGTAAYIFRGIDLSGRSNVTIKNMEIRNFMDGIYLVPSSNNTITRNYITANTASGIWTGGVSNTITGNYIANNNIGILFHVSHDLIYHNNFINNTKQVADICWTNPWLPSSATILDDGYPSGGNYWSDYEGRYPNATEKDGSGIWDTPYVIDENNQDNYPLIHLYGPIRNLDTNLTYLTIQSAIDAPETLDGQTILVDAGTYYEHVFINKSISLIGENRSTTVIDGNGTGNVVSIYSDFVTVSGFTIQNSGFFLGLPSGIEIASANCTICNNVITSNKGGISLLWGGNHTITNNTIFSNNYCIYLVYSADNKIFHNYFINNTNQVYTTGATNSWDDGYPSGGNYWSDYEERYPDAEEIDESGIWDTPYVIDGNNQDNYPIVPEFPALTSILVFVILTVATVIYKRRLHKTPIH